MAARGTRAALAAALAAGLVLAVPLSASAHIRVTPNQVAAGSTNVQLTFSVPTEADDAPNGETTVLVRVQLEKAHPFSTLYVQPVAGWTSKVETAPLAKPVTINGARVATAATAVVWTANPGSGIPRGSFQDFVIAVSPIPKVGRLTMPATQQLSNGATERWVQPMPHGKGAEPTHPAPTLFIDETPPTLTGGGMSGMSMSGTTEAASTPSAATSLPIGYSIAAVLMGAAGLVLGGLAFLRTRRRVS
jgi:uncharacterized protein YcnI